MLINFSTIVLSGYAMWFGLVFGQHLWQLSELAWKDKNVLLSRGISKPHYDYQNFAPFQNGNNPPYKPHYQNGS